MPGRAEGPLGRVPSDELLAPVERGARSGCALCVLGRPVTSLSGGASP